MVDEQGEPQYEVGAIVVHQCVPLRTGERKHRCVVPNKYRITAYFVKWMGYNEASWVENIPENLEGRKELVKAYRRSQGLSEPEYV
jgi:hypothetical protein